jgi:hypothetical protein
MQEHFKFFKEFLFSLILIFRNISFSFLDLNNYLFATDLIKRWKWNENTMLIKIISWK